MQSKSKLRASVGVRQLPCIAASHSSAAGRKQNGILRAIPSHTHRRQITTQRHCPSHSRIDLVPLRSPWNLHDDDAWGDPRLASPLVPARSFASACDCTRVSAMAGALLLSCCRRHIQLLCPRPSADGVDAAVLGVSLFRNYNGTGLVMGAGFLRPFLNPSKSAGWQPIAAYSTGIASVQATWAPLRSTSGFAPAARSWASHHKLLQCGYEELKRKLFHDWRHVLKAAGTDLRTLKSESQIAFQIRSRRYSGILVHRSLRMLATAASLACARSQVIPRIIAVVVGEATLAHQSAAGAEPFLVRLESSQPHHNAFIVALIFSLLEFFILVIRAAYLAVLFTPAVVLAPFADSCGAKFRKRWVSLVRFSLENAGAAFIKWGQWAAARPDLFPRDLCAQLSMLHSKAPAHKYGHTKRIIEGAFGRKIDEIFEDFEEEPVASGSIAQIHRAVLRYRYPGQMSKPMVVAVKVRHPGVSQIIQRDFTIINWCAKVSNFVPGLAWLRLDESIQQFAVFMLTQVDLAREAAHLSRFIYNFRRWKDVSFPKPLYPLVHPSVLVETFEQGESVSRFVDRRGKNRLNTALASIGTHTLLKMLLVDNFIHADLHPGNILVRMEPDTKQLFKSRPHVVLLDVGMTAELNVQDRSTLLDFFKAIAQMDGRLAAECTLKFSRSQSCPNPGAFIDDVDKTFQFWDTSEGSSLHAGQCMQELLEQVRRHKVNVDGDVCTVMVTTLVLEGWQRKLDPEFNIMDTLRQLLFKADWVKSLSYTIDGVMAP